MSFVKMNVNNTVKVKLNEQGVAILKEQNEKLRKSFPNFPSFEHHTDCEGYSRFQLWDFMKKFGPHINLGGLPPFDMDIFVEVEDNPQGEGND